MKKKIFIYVSLLLLCTIVNSENVNATGGGLRKNSIKTCANGVTYGMHSDGKGGTHWHIAVTNGTNYYAKGGAFSSDPCPNSNLNKGTAGATSQSDSHNNSNNRKPNNSDNVNNNSSNHSNVNSSNKKTQKPKNSDTSIKSITIDNEKISISENLEYKTTKKEVNIEVIPTNSKSSVKINNKELVIGDNKITFIVTAEDSSTKEYYLNITREKLNIKLTLKKFVLDGTKIEFKNNKAKTNKFKNDSNLEYSYELDDNNAKIKILVDGKDNNDKAKIINLKDESKIKIILYDEYGNQNTYEIEVIDYSFFMTFIVYELIVFTMLSPFAIIGIIICLKKNKQKM